MSSKQVYLFCFLFMLISDLSLNCKFKFRSSIKFNFTLRKEKVNSPKEKSTPNYTHTNDDNEIAFIYQKKDKSVAIVYKNGAIQESSKNSRTIFNSVNGKKNFIKGKHLGRIAYANVDDIVYFEWSHQENRTYFHFPETENRFFFDEVKPAGLIAQLSDLNKEYIMHCKNKNYINILHFTNCNEDQDCRCNSSTISIDCSCNSAKNINKKLDELKTS